MQVIAGVAMTANAMMIGVVGMTGAENQKEKEKDRKLDGGAIVTAMTADATEMTVGTTEKTRGSVITHRDTKMIGDGILRIRCLHVAMKRSVTMVIVGVVRKGHAKRTEMTSKRQMTIAKDGIGRPAIETDPGGEALPMRKNEKRRRI